MMMMGNNRPGGQGGRPGGGPPGIQAKGEQARDFRGTIKRLLVNLRDYQFQLVIVLLFAIASTIFMIVGPKILGQATTKLFEGVVAQIAGTGSVDFVYIGNIIALLAVLYIISAFFSYVQGWIMAGVSMKVTYRFRKDIAEKINRMPLKYFDGTNHGEVLSRITNDVDTVSQTLNQSLSQIVTSVTTLIGVFVMMLTISWVMTLVALVMIPLSFGIIALVISKSQKFFKEQQDYLGHVNGHIEEMYSGHNVVKAFNGEAKSVEKFDVYNNTLYGSAWKSQFLSGLLMPILTFVGNLNYVAVAIMGGYLAVRGSLAIGDIQAFIQYVRLFTQPIAQIANISNVLQQTAAAAERVFEFMDEAEEVPETVTNLTPDKIGGSVEFKNVHFGYNPDKIIINDFSAKVNPGQKIAIVGPTGAGKTTIVKLLMRFYDVNSGAILVDGHDIRDFTRQDLRSMFGMVLQDAWLYNDTIMENIRYGRLDATDEEVIEAAKAAHVDHFVRTLPVSYHMILDEATSSVDTRTEVLIQKAMDNLMHNRTSFIIAHRLSTIRNADLILVMKDGDIVEQGSHLELLAKGGFYADLYNSQFENAPVEDVA